MATNKKEKTENQDQKETKSEDIQSQLILSETELQERLKKARDITRKRVFAAAGAGLIPFPTVDLVALSGIQTELVNSLCNLYDIPFRQEFGRTVIIALIGGILPIHASMLLASFVKFIPLIGTITGTVTLSVVGGACTYAVGRIFIQHFEAGGNLLNFKPEKMCSYFQIYYKDGEKMAAEASKKQGLLLKS